MFRTISIFLIKARGSSTKNNITHDEIYKSNCVIVTKPKWCNGQTI